MRGVRQVQVILVTDGADPEMTDLRRAVRKLGGTVHAIFSMAHAMTVQVAASQHDDLADRDDVLNVVPNRPTRRTFSTLEMITGAIGPNVRTGDARTTYYGLGGTGVVVAVLDSGVMRSHEAFLDGNGVNRVKRNVSMLNNSVANWATGAD
ncbi:MAG: S8 family peptidase, partial [Pseudomonadota bacterium]|nr:S8 family peptidase [Pseudomonadota bacterium]